MLILLWLVPPLLVTLVACLVVTWLGRDNDAQVDREEAAARMGAALARQRQREARRKPARGEVRPDRTPDRSRGVAVRPSRPSVAGAAAPAEKPPAPRPQLPSAAAGDIPDWVSERESQNRQGEHGSDRRTA